jgi:hypothetical protein
MFAVQSHLAWVNAAGQIELVRERLLSLIVASEGVRDSLEGRVEETGSDRLHG